MPTNIADNENETVSVTIKLPRNVAQYLRDQVAAGIYGSPDEFIESLLLTEDLFDTIPQDDLIHWINTEGVRRLEAWKHNPSSGLDPDRAFAGLCGEE